jgi:hypothetical protein
MNGEKDQDVGDPAAKPHDPRAPERPTQHDLMKFPGSKGQVAEAIDEYDADEN